MNKDKTIKIIGIACTIIGFGITMVTKQLEDEKLNRIVEKEVQKQLENK